MLSMRKNGDQSIHDYASSSIKIENELAASGFELPDFDKNFALIEGLPETFGTIKAILREQKKLTFPNLMAKLEVLQKELRYSLGPNARVEEDSKAFISDRFIKETRKGKKNINVKCH